MQVKNQIPDLTRHGKLRDREREKRRDREQREKSERTAAV